MIGGIGMEFLKTYLRGFAIVFAILTAGRTITGNVDMTVGNNS